MPCVDGCKFPYITYDDRETQERIQDLQSMSIHRRRSSLHKSRFRPRSRKRGRKFDIFRQSPDYNFHIRGPFHDLSLESVIDIIPRHKHSTQADNSSMYRERVERLIETSDVYLHYTHDKSHEKLPIHPRR